MSTFRIGVVSDTHCPERVPFSVLTEIMAIFKGCDCILHAGDIEAKTVLDTLSAVAPVYAVHGDDEIDTGYLPEKRVVEVGGIRIGMHHSHRPLLEELPSRLKSTLGLHSGPSWGGIHQWLVDKFKDDDVQLIVFGHFHMPYSQVHDGILLLNPGSIYKMSPDSLAYRMRYAHSPVRRLTARLQYHTQSSDRIMYPPTVAYISINSQQIESEILELSPVDYTS